jgi:hypothetical protein
MIVPIIRKIVQKERCLIERVLPTEGIISVETGTLVEPFNHLGECRFSQNRIEFAKGFKPEDFRTDKRFYYSESLLGRIGREKIVAPFDGNMEIDSRKRYVFSENEKKYPLLAGVWGIVKSIYKNKSVLLETQVKDLLLATCTESHASGELVVFPNPTDILKKSYLENFAKGIKGKVIYIGDFVGLDILQKAYDMQASAVLVGSSHSDTFVFAKEKNFAFGIISGFGNIKTPESVYKYLSSISYRYVFFNGDQNILRIPIKPEDISKDEGPKPLLKQIEVGMTAQVLQDPYFGWVGEVDRTSESSIFVRFGIDKNPVEIRSPNFLIFE